MSALSSSMPLATPASRPAHVSKYAVLAMLVLAYTFNFIDRQILGILASSIKKDLSLTDTELGLMGGLAFAVFYTGLGIPVASLADRWSRTWIMTGALTLWSAFTAACGMATGFWQLFACRMGVGIGEAGGVAPAYSLISDLFPKEQRARALAVYSFGIPIGSAAGLLFGGLIAKAIDWRAAFFVVGLAGVVIAPVFRLVVKEPPRAAPAKVQPSLGATLKVLLPKSSFWLLSLGAAASSVCGYGLAFWLPTFFERSFQLGLVERSWFLAGVTFFGGLLGVWGGGWMADRLATKRKGVYPLIPAVSFLIALPVFVLAVNSTALPEDVRLKVAFVLFLVPQGLNLAWLGPILSSVQQLVPPAMRSTASAAFLFINNLVGIAFGTFYFGAASDFFKPTFGDQSMRWAIFSGLGFYLVGSALFFAASRKLERDSVEEG